MGQQPIRHQQLLRLVAGAMAGLALLAWPAIAQAHANLERSVPAANANVSTSPAQVQLWFTERPEPRLTEIEVLNQQAQRVDHGQPVVSPDDSSSLIERLQPNLPEGTYTVSWRATSAEDGHVTQGALAFGIGVPPSTRIAPAPTADAAAQGPFSMFVHWLGYLAVAGLLGATCFPLLVLEPLLRRPDMADVTVVSRAKAVARRADGLAQVFAILGVVAAILAVLDQMSRSSRETSVRAFGTLMDTELGRLLVLRGGVALLVLGLLLLALPELQVPSPHRSLGAAAAHVFNGGQWAMTWPRAALLAGILGELLLFSLTSHASTATEAPRLTLVVDWLHLTLASVWVGGLASICLALIPVAGFRLRARPNPEPDDAAANLFFGAVVRQFSALALACTIGLGATGLYEAWVHVGRLDLALTTGYGRTLVIKSAMFAEALYLAGLYRYAVQPALRHPGGASATHARRFLTRSLAAEALLGVGVLAATAVLAVLSPANSNSTGGSAVIGTAAQAAPAAGESRAPGKQVITKTVGDLNVSLDIEPLYVGPNTFQITLRSKGALVANAEKVELQLHSLDMDTGLSVVDLVNRGQGVYSAQSDALSMNGRWEVDALIRVPGQLDQRTSFDLQLHR